MKRGPKPDVVSAGFAALGITPLILATLSSPVSAESNCMTRVLADVPALEAPEQVKSKQSGTFGPVTSVKIEKSSGKMFFCAANTYCYGSNSFQITTPCRFKLDKSYGYGAFFVYSAR